MAKAIVVFNTSRKIKFVSQEQGRTLFAVLNGDAEPANEKQAKFISTVQRVFLDRSDPKTPTSYHRVHPVERNMIEEVWGKNA